MSISPRNLREIILQMLYSFEIHKENNAFVDDLFDRKGVTEGGIALAQEKTLLIIEKLPLIDEKIAAFSPDYALNRISLVEKSAVRLGAYEILFDPKIPPKVAISEGVRLTRKFSTGEGANFVNAVLDAIYKSLEG